MIVNTSKQYVSLREWSLGFTVSGKLGTLVVFLGTGRAWSFSCGKRECGKPGRAFGLCAGHLLIGGVIGQ
jgi:hypothetical protein